jgi:hypothetical protein
VKRAANMKLYHTLSLFHFCKEMCFLDFFSSIVLLYCYFYLYYIYFLLFPIRCTRVFFADPTKKLIHYFLNLFSSCCCCCCRCRCCLNKFSFFRFIYFIFEVLFVNWVISCKKIFSIYFSYWVFITKQLWFSFELRFREIPYKYNSKTYQNRN